MKTNGATEHSLIDEVSRLHMKQLATDNRVESIVADMRSERHVVADKVDKLLEIVADLCSTTSAVHARLDDVVNELEALKKPKKRR